MVNSKVLLALLLVCSILIPFTILPARAQTTTTVTSVQYFTLSQTSTMYSTTQTTTTNAVTLRYDGVPYGYVNQTGSFELTQFKQMNGGGRFNDGGPCLYFDYFLLNITKGHEIRGHFEAYQHPPYALKEAPVQFYILNSDQLERFKHSYCGWYDDWKGDVYAYAFSYNLDWVAPQNGEYAFLFLSPGSYYGTISFTANDYSTIVQSSTVTSTSTRTYTLQSTQLMVSIQPGILQQPSTSFYLLALILALIIGFIILKLKIKRQPKQ